MRVLAISHEYPPIGGGGANAAFYLLNGFADKGHRITLVTTAYDRSGMMNNCCDYDGTLQIVEVSSKRSDPASCSFMEMLDYLVKAGECADKLVSEAIKRGEPYNVCLVFFGIPSGPIGYRLKRKYGLPYVIRFGGGDVPGFQKRFTYIYKILTPVIRKIWRDADVRIANSDGLKKMALEFCDKYEFDVIPNGVDTDVYSPETECYDMMLNFEEPQQKKVCINILFVSRLIERKGLQHIIPILTDVAGATGRIITLTVVGDGPYRENLEKMALYCGIHSQKNHTEHYGDKAKVIFKGDLRGDDLLAEYRRGDIFILPSSNEGMPNVVLEAMACGLPVVMTPCQGSGELVKGNGCIVPVNKFREALINLIDKPELIRTFSVESRRRAVLQFSWKRVIDLYIQILLDINS